jgi:hypothetical protein
MRQVERCCFSKSPRKELLFLMIHVGQQDSLTQFINAASADADDGRRSTQRDIKGEMK